MKKEKERKNAHSARIFSNDYFWGLAASTFFPSVPFFQTTSREEVGAKKLIRLTAAKHQYLKLIPSPAKENKTTLCVHLALQLWWYLSCVCMCADARCMGVLFSLHLPGYPLPSQKRAFFGLLPLPTMFFSPLRVGARLFCTVPGSSQ